jgi:tetratricopeptide (TPR) repeat protein
MAVALAGDATAGKSPTPKQLYEEAIGHYNLGEWQQAIDKFKEAYRKTRDPALLFNLGQCYRQMHDPANALLEYRAFLREVPGTPSREEIERLIKLMEEALDKKPEKLRATDETATESHPPQVLVPPPSPAPAVAASLPAPVVVRTVEVTPPKPRSKRIAGWVLASGAVGLLAVGGGLLGGATGAEDSARSARTLGDQLSLLDRSDTFRSAGYAMIGIGAAAGVAAIIVFALPGGK